MAIRTGAILVALLATPLCGFAKEIEFAGVKIPAGKTIAFVCDGSRWQKNKIEDLADDLLDAVESLMPEQQVSIIFFADDKAYGPNDGKPLPATDDNKRLIKDWLKRVELGDAPTPIAGLKRAFDVKPDTIVFITDGQFKNYDEVIERVATLNREHAAKVWPVGYFRTVKEDDSADFMRFMKKLAADNGGENHEVYVDELGRRRRR
jgi:hypothetical protein